MTAKQRDMMMALAILGFFLYKSKVANDNFKLKLKQLESISPSAAARLEGMAATEDEEELVGSLSFEV